MHLLFKGLFLRHIDYFGPVSNLLLCGKFLEIQLQRSLDEIDDLDPFQGGYQLVKG